ncbi:hypothetical protein GCM10011390_43300 [Aureimonas endophytica]|uniref:Uncharacterized protein n=1 Tax=Aureimonas endophytica TaxID=2027858 RepID=A0A916ZYT6_9HYPH|nr:hypothetical protein [Aureimonas endophytica]GGE19413.1 hypothetical protein GCM10011390_43300 [Aureimonas endophytica]
MPCSRHHPPSPTRDDPPSSRNTKSTGAKLLLAVAALLAPTKAFALAILAIYVPADGAPEAINRNCPRSGCLVHLTHLSLSVSYTDRLRIRVVPGEGRCAFADGLLWRLYFRDETAIEESLSPIPVDGEAPAAQAPCGTLYLKPLNGYVP